MSKDVEWGVRKKLDQTKQDPEMKGHLSCDKLSRAPTDLQGL